jgi:UDP-glucose 4-epimerase
LNGAYDPRSKRRNIAGLLAHEQFTLIEGDLCQESTFGDIGRHEYVFHLAGRAGVRASFGGNAPLYIRDNILATRSLLQEVLSWQAAKFVYASSSSVYGDCRGAAVQEIDTLAPESPYAMTKLAGELLCRDSFERDGVPAVCLRYFTVYGPGQRPDMAVHTFISAALAGRRVEVFGDGRQTRDFTFVDDIVEGTIRAAFLGAPGQAYNLGAERPVSLLELLSQVERATGRAVRIDFSERREGDVGHTRANTTLARQELGWSPATSLEEGLARQVESLTLTASHVPGQYIERMVRRELSEAV